MIAGRILIRRAWKKIGTALMKTIVLFFIYGMFQFLVAFQVELLLCWRVQSQIFWSFRRRQRFRRTWCSCSFLIFKLILCTYLAALQCPSYDCQHQPTPGDKHGWSRAWCGNTQSSRWGHTRNSRTTKSFRYAPIVMQMLVFVIHLHIHTSTYDHISELFCLSCRTITNTIIV